MRIARITWRRLLRDERGAATLEFAIVVPVLLTLLLAIIDFGRLMFTVASLAAAVREGARHAAVLVDPTDAASLGVVRTRVTTAFQPLGGSALTAGQVVISAVDGAGTITVAVSNYTFQPITPIAAFVGLGTIQLTRRAVFRWERSA